MEKLLAVCIVIKLVSKFTVCWLLLLIVVVRNQQYFRLFKSDVVLNDLNRSESQHVKKYRVKSS